MKLAKLLREIREPRWLAFRIQRCVLNPSRRAAISRVLSKFLPRRNGTVLEPSCESLARSLQSDGFVFVPPVSTELVAAIRAYFLDKELHDPWRPELGKFKITGPTPPTTHVAHFDATDVLGAPHLLDLANSPDVLATVEAVFGCKPTISYMAAWWSLAGRGPAEQAELFHRDVDDWRFIKLFVYLTDVGEESGPHVFVRGSHVQPKLLPITRYSDEDIEQAFGHQQIMRYVGPAGTAFLEDTFGFHRGVPPLKENRLIFQVVYSMLPVPYGPKRPIAVANSDCDFDRYVNRVYLA